MLWTGRTEFVALAAAYALAVPTTRTGISTGCPPAFSLSGQDPGKVAVLYLAGFSYDVVRS
jgi:hypothetical protein